MQGRLLMCYDRFWPQTHYSEHANSFMIDLTPNPRLWTRQEFYDRSTSHYDFAQWQNVPCSLLFSYCCVLCRWVCQLWNLTIAPTIFEAVIKGSGTETAITNTDQSKFASTALYVLMQRAIVPGCPLSGQGLYSWCFNVTCKIGV